MKIEYIDNKQMRLGIILRANYEYDGIIFFTDDEYSQQLGYMKREAGYSIQPHIHVHIERRVMHTQETLFIKSGKVRVTFYSDEKKFITSRILCGGDVILLVSGGHGFEFLETSEIIEVKQGPYVGENDKIRFEV